VLCVVLLVERCALCAVRRVDRSVSFSFHFLGFPLPLSFRSLSVECVNKTVDIARDRPPPHHLISDDITDAGTLRTDFAAE
jgi:hypothetical protein